MSELQVHPVVITGGLQDSKARPEPEVLQELDNFAVFRGRFALRAPVIEVARLASVTDYADDVLGCTFLGGKMYALSYDDSENAVYIHEGNLDGSSMTRQTNAVWSGIGARPRPIMVPFEGGLADEREARIFICDYNGLLDAVYYKPGDDSVTYVTSQVDGGTGADNMRFTYLASYQFHMWGFGFYEDGAMRPEMARFSQPGLIPADDPDDEDEDLQEWHVSDFRPIGRRGDGVTAVGYAGGSMIIFKAHEVYALFGYDRQSWAIRLLSERVGAVGPEAVASTGDGLCFFWTDRGPYVTDGQRVQDLSEDIRKHVLAVEPSDEAVAEFSSDDGIVYFHLVGGGSSNPDHYLAFDKERKLWFTGQNKATGGSTLLVAYADSIPSLAAPGPVDTPSGATLSPLHTDVTADGEIVLEWVNSDTALDTITEVYIDADNPPTTKVGEASSGIDNYLHSGAGTDAPLYGRVRHVRNQANGAYSAASAVARTRLAKPTQFDVWRQALNELRVQFEQNQSGTPDVEIYRRDVLHGGFTLLTTLSEQATGTITHDDTDVTNGLEYEYYAVVVDSGKQDSLPSAKDSAFAVAASSITAVSHAWNMGRWPPTFFHVHWTPIVGRPEDMCRISVNRNGEGYVWVATLPLNVKYYRHWIPWWYDSGAPTVTWRYKLETLDNGTTVVDTDETTQTDEKMVYA